jgi:hypothetical protein
MSLKVLEEGCVICGATWGNYWSEIEGQRMFFCCEICAFEFRNMVDEVKLRTGWASIDEIKIEGDQRGRNCIAISGSRYYRFFIGFDSAGKILAFNEQRV